jgi:hypothetical protein
VGDTEFLETDGALKDLVNGLVGTTELADEQSLFLLLRYIDLFRAHVSGPALDVLENDIGLLLTAQEEPDTPIVCDLPKAPKQ